MFTALNKVRVSVGGRCSSQGRRVQRLLRGKHSASMGCIIHGLLLRIGDDESQKTEFLTSDPGGKSTGGEAMATKMIGLALLLYGAFGLPSLAHSQSDVRAYRAANHLVLAVRQLKPQEVWQGLTLNRGKDEHFAILKWGAGCFVSQDGLMLTANHVVTGGELYFVAGWDGDLPPVPAELVKRDEKDDLALVRVKPPTVNLVWISKPFANSSSIVEGENVFVWAYLLGPNAFMQFLRRGIVSNNTEVLGVEHILYIETTAADGASGSPVFLRSTGQPIGIVSLKLTLPGGLPLPAGIVGMVPGETVDRFLHDSGVPGY
jgi:S1-C subfamily serine protease